MGAAQEEVRAGHGKRKRPLVRAEPRGHRDDGSPVADGNQAYVTRTGKQYHTKWCPIMAAQWRDKPGTVFLSALADVGERGLCPQCQHDPESGSPKRPLIKVEATSHREDGSPVAGEGQVYVTRTGKQYHTKWCSIMAAHWRDNPGRIFLSSLADVGERRGCPNCEDANQDFKFERAEWQRLNKELDRLGRIIARTLVAKGPEGVNQLGPHVIRFRETEAELNKLSHRVAGVFPDSYIAPNW